MAAASRPGVHRHAERVTGQQLDDLFDIWLFTPAKPEGIETVSAAREHAGHAARRRSSAGMMPPADWLLLVR